MNYIRHIQAFYNHIKRDSRLSASHISLYMAIFQLWNFNRFQNPFRINREELMLLSKIGSKNTYHRCVKELHQAGYIHYDPPLTKFQPVKISVTRLDLKDDEKAANQLDLFGTNNQEYSTPPAPLSRQAAPSYLQVTAPGKHSSFTLTVSRNHTLPCPKNDTPLSPKNDTPPCPKYDTIPVPLLTVVSTEIDTIPVSKMGHFIKHKQVNNKYCVFKTSKKTHTQIFEKNKDLANAITKLAGIKPAEENQNQDAGAGAERLAKSNSILPGKIEVSLQQVERYFQENNYPVAEGQKFFYYNQGKGWMLTVIMPVKDWQSLAHKWMLNKFHSKEIPKLNNTHGPNQHIDPGPGKDYSEPL